MEQSPTPTFPINLTKENGFDKRTKIIKELYTSENIYVQNLKQIIEGYMEPLKDNKILNSKVISGIFSNVGIIYKFHLFFSSSLTQKVEQWDDDQLIGDIFLSMAPYLKLYSQYCSNYDYSMSLVQLHKKTNPQFSQFLTDSQKNETFKGSYITSFLILPIQRIPRYEMFLKELLQKTREDHPDRENLAKSLDLVSELAKSVNEACEKAENINKMIEIAKNINMEKLLKPTRKYCREDDVELSLEGFVSPSKCYVFNDLIVLTLKKSKTISQNYISYQLGLCWVYDKSQDTVQMVTPTVTMLIKFNDINTKICWQTEIQGYIHQLIEKSSKIKKSRGDYIIEEEGGIFVARAISELEKLSQHEEKKKKKNKLLDWRNQEKKAKKSKRFSVSMSEPTVSVAKHASGNSADSLSIDLHGISEKRKSFQHDKLQVIEAFLSSRASLHSSENDKFKASKSNTLRANLSSVDLSGTSLYGTTGKKTKKKRRDIADIFNQMNNSVSQDI